MMSSEELILSQTDHSGSQPSLSLEFFPPCDVVSIATLLQGAIAKLTTFNPDFCSVTYGAGGSTRQGTQDLVQAMLATKIRAAPHLSIGGSSDAALAQLVDYYQEIGVTKILCLRGDQPSGAASKPAYVKDLVERLQQHFPKQFELAVAAYPEVHPDASSAEDDFAHFVAKVNAGASSAITQYFYNPEAYGYFLERCAKAGAGIPRWLAKSMSSYASDDKGLVDFGVEVAASYAKGC